jgi:hypothetical protein
MSSKLEHAPSILPMPTSLWMRVSSSTSCILWTCPTRSSDLACAWPSNSGCRWASLGSALLWPQGRHAHSRHACGLSRFSRLGRRFVGCILKWIPCRENMKALGTVFLWLASMKFYSNEQQLEDNNKQKYEVFMHRQFFFQKITWHYHMSKKIMIENIDNYAPQKSMVTEKICVVSWCYSLGEVEHCLGSVIMNITYTKLSDIHYMLIFLSIISEWSNCEWKVWKTPRLLPKRDTRSWHQTLTDLDFSILATMISELDHH